jgi:cation:H+ antiporter
MALPIILLLIGFAILVKGADFLVLGSSSVAKRFNVSSLAIGLTVVAFGTSTPELIVSVLSAVNGRGDASFGNIIGSNNFNTYLILGTAGLIYPLVVQRNTIKYEVPLSFFAAALLLVLVNDSRIWGSGSDELSRMDSAILLIIFLAFMYYIFQMMKRGANLEESSIRMFTLPASVGLIVLGLAMLVGGGTLVVENAVTIAEHYHLSEKLIGLTILAAGTSLPELATSAVAAYRRNTDIAIGNVIGSNIFNLTVVLGITGLIHPIPYNSSMNFDIIVMGSGAIVLMIFMFTINQRKLDRWEAFLLFVGYITYVVYQIFHDQPLSLV